MRFLSTTTVAITLLAAAPNTQPQSTAPTIQVYSRETLVDVTVTDGNGKPVRGLKQSDFTVTEDGSPQSIRSFHEFGKQPPAATHAPPKLPPDVYTNLQTATGPLNVILFDDINDGDGPYARWGARDFIKSMAPGTQVALLALGDKLTVLQGPTSDPAALLKVVNRPVKGLRAEVDDQVDHCAVPIILGRATLAQLRLVASYLAGIKGRKNLIWVGNGNAEIIFNNCFDWKLPLQQTYDLLEDSQVTVYPLDPRGVGNLGARQLAMEAVAEGTGGVAYYENNDIKGLMVKAVDTGSSYYSLSYVPPGQTYDGKYHAISVTVDRPHLHLIYRKGYSDEDPFQIAHPPETVLGITTQEAKPTDPVADPLANAMSSVAPPATQLLFDVRVDIASTPPSPTDPPVLGQLDPKLKKLALTRYDFLFALPQSQITFADAGGGTYSGSLEFEVAAFDTDGRLETVRSLTMPLPLTNQEYGQFIRKPFQIFMQLDLPPGESILRAGILDGVSKKVGTVEIPVTVGTHRPLMQQVKPSSNP